MEVFTAPEPSYSHAVVLYYWKQCGPCKEFAPIFQKALERAQKKGVPINVYMVEVMEQRPFLQEHNVDLGDGVPRLVLYGGRDGTEERVFEGRTIKDVYDAMTACARPEGSTVAVKTLKSISIHPSSMPVPSLIMYYSPACPFCKVFIPTYVQFAAAHSHPGDVPVLAVDVKAHPDARTHLLANAYSDTVPHIVYHASATKQVPFKQRRTMAALDSFYTTLSKARTGGGGRIRGGGGSAAFARDLLDGTPLTRSVDDALTALSSLASETFGAKYATLFHPQHAVMYLAAWHRNVRPPEDKLVVFLLPKAAVPLVENGEKAIVGVLQGKRRGPVKAKLLQDARVSAVVQKKLQEGYDDVSELDPIAQIFQELGYKLRLASANPA